MTRTGVYFVANDAVADWLIAALESLKQYNPGMPVALIPFNQDTSLTLELASSYGCSVFEPKFLDEFDRIGSMMHPQAPRKWNYFRKFACFWGPFERFLFIDTDVVVLCELAPLFTALDSHCLQFLYFDADHTCVYLEGPFRDRMKNDHGSRGFNSGSFISRRDAMKLDEVRRFAEEATESGAHTQFFPGGHDQPFLNYCVDRSGITKDRLGIILPDFTYSTWANHELCHDGEVYRSSEFSQPDFGRQLPLVHWSGSRCSGEPIPNFELLWEFRSRNPLPCRALRQLS